MPPFWLKKNPFMSVWLSMANRVAGSLRGQAAAQVRRQATTAMTDATRALAKPRRAAPKPAAPRAPRRR